MTAEFARLQESRIKSQKNHQRHAGMEAGKQWAIDKAEWAELNAVAEMDEAGTNINSFCQMLSWHGYGENDATLLFGRDASEDRPISDEEVEGFILGARLVRNEVEHASHSAG
jgi:hypothetical protein